MLGWMNGLVGVLLFCSVGGTRPATADAATLTGTWRGGYGSGLEVKEVTARFYPNMKVVMSEKQGSQVRQASGNYQVKDGKILLAAISLQGSGITLQGNLNKTFSFVDGTYNTPDGIIGSFYLHKVAAQPNP